MFLSYKTNEVLRALSDDEETSQYALQRMSEITENGIAAEREHSIDLLLRRIAELKHNH